LQGRAKFLIDRLKHSAAAKCIGFASTSGPGISSVVDVNMTAIIALSVPPGSHPRRDPDPPLERASATVNALVSYLEAMCTEWAATPEVERLAATRLAADTARQVQDCLRAAKEGGAR
jgi:hypothetical protein